jgi:transcriptional regulator with XRE-family HTH domain
MKDGTMKKQSPESSSNVLKCPDCGSREVETQQVLVNFQYGSGGKAAELEAKVPFRKCTHCGFEYTDAEAEDVRHDAVCRYLEVMTPDEILTLRKDLGFTRAQLAEVSRIGEASLARWELAEVIQNPGYDSYLYLLSFAENIERLQQRRSASLARDGREKISEFPALRAIGGSAARQKAAKEEREFQIRVVA